MKRLLYLVSCILLCIASPVEAQRFEFQNGNVESENTFAHEGPFHISKDTTPEWIICENIKNERIFELCLQRDAANASLESAEILYWQAWIGFLTLLAAILAAVFSGFAVRYAYRTVALALKIGISELRPYIKMDIDIYNKDEKGYSELGAYEYEVAFSLKNIGKSEALMQSFAISEEKVDRTIEFVENVLNIEKKSNGSFEEKAINEMSGDNQYIYPNQEPRCLQIGINDTTIEEAISEGKDLIYPFVVEYMDSLGTKYKAACAYRARFSRSKKSSNYELIRQSYVKLQQDTILETPKISSWKID